MRLTNPHPVPVHLPTLGLSVEPDEEVEITGDDAKSLKAQGWGRADKPEDKPSTVADIKSSVGDDPDAAAAALDAEKSSDNPRVSLVSHLENVIEKSTTDEPSGSTKEK